MRVVVINHLTLDGVMQAPGRPDENTRGGFELGGWAGPHVDDVVNAAMGARIPRSGGLLLGRRSYEDMLGHWNKIGGAFKDGLSQTTKYVASSSPDINLAWPNSTLLSGDVPSSVGALREQPGGKLVIMGSGRLIRSLLPHALIDELFLMIHPVVLGSGRHLFGPTEDRIALTLVDSATTSTGLIMATYRP